MGTINSIKTKFIKKMVRVEKCFFCGGPVYPGHGSMFIRNDCKTFRFCRAKCLRHFKAKHNPRKMKWTKAYRKTHGKELMYDSTLDFEKRREELVRYNRDLYVKTVQAIGKIEQIKAAREKRFKNARIKEAKRRNVDAIDRLLVRRPEYIKDKAVSDKYKEKNRASMAAQLAQLKQKKSKLQNELIPNEDDMSEEEDSEIGSDMEEENMDDIQA